MDCNSNNTNNININLNNNTNDNYNYNNFGCGDSLNSFHYFDLNKEELFDIEMDKLNSSAVNINMFTKIFDSIPFNKKNSLDLSDCDDQIFVDKLNISEIKPLHNDCKSNYI